MKDDLTKRLVRIGISILAVSSVAYAASYPEPSVDEPSSNYTFPSEFTAFSPVVSGVAASGTPEIAEWTRSNKPGKTLAITGENLSSYTGSSEGDDSRFDVFAPGVAIQSGLVKSLDGRMASVKLPYGLPSGTMYLMWPRNSKGIGTPVAINRAEAWWVGPKKAAKGETISVYGRNLELGGGVSHLYIEELNLWLKSAAANPCKADFKLPGNISNGKYTIWAHNGHGRKYGWTLPLKLEVISKKSWSGPSVNVKDHGAKGDGVANDYNAILSALSACPANGTVYFPAGRYAVGESIRVSMTNKRFLGDGPEASVITTHSSYSASSGYGMFHNDLKGMEFRDMGFSANPGQVSIVIRCRSAEDTRFVNCRFDDLKGSLGSYTATVDMQNSENLTIEDCTIITYRGCNFGGADGIFFKNTDFRAWGDKAAGYMLVAGGADNLSMVGCTATHYDNSDYTDGWGWCQGRFLVLDGNGGANRNTYVGDCKTYDMAPRWNWDRGRYEKDSDGNSYQSHQNAGEQILAEHQRTMFRGDVDSATATSVTCSGDISSLSSQILTVVAGRGFGQSRFVSSVDASSGRLTVSEPWNVKPDSSSTVAVGRYMSRMAVYGNHLDGPAHVARPFEVSAYRPPYDPAISPVNTASCGINLFGGASECIIENNIFTEIEDAVNLWSLAQDKYTGISTAQPNYFNIINNNYINGTVVVLETIADVSSHPFTGDWAIIGNVLRDNVYENVAESVYSEGSSDAGMKIELTILENNVEGSGLPEGPEGPEGPPSTPVAVSLSISGPAEVDENTWTPYVCVAHYSDGSSVQVAAEWSVTEPFKIHPFGLLEVSEIDADHTVSIRASFEGLSSEIVVAVKDVPPTIIRLEIQGAMEVEEETWAPYACIAHYSDGTSEQVSPDWSVRAPFTIYPFGLLEAPNVDGDQSIVLNAAFEGLSAELAITVKDKPPVLIRLEVLGAGEVEEDTWSPYSCMAHYSDGSSAQVFPEWKVTDPFVIYPFGLFEAGAVNGDQTVFIAAFFEGLSAGRVVSIKDVSASSVLLGLEIEGASEIKEGSFSPYTCFARYSDGQRIEVTPSWSVDHEAFSIDSSGMLAAGLMTYDAAVTVSASYEGFVANHGVAVQSLGEIVYPLSGFEGKWLDCYLYDETAREYRSLGVGFEPDELVIRDLDPSHRYWLGIREFDEQADGWPLIHGCWIEQTEEITLH